MKKFTLPLLVILICACLSSFIQSANPYKKFRTGTYTYQGFEDKVRIIRTENEQIEIYNNGESKLIMDIKWENDSTYVLTHQEAINAPGCMQKGDQVRTIITSVEEGRYSCSFTSKRCGSGETVFIRLK